MRTKTLLLAAGLSVAGIATSMAQVYSVNAVGYVNVSVATVPGPFTYAIIANPLEAANGNLLSTVLPPASLPFGMSIYFLAPGGFESALNLGDSWVPDLPFPPGVGGIVEIPEGSGATTTFTFVGEVKQGHLVNTVPGAPGALPIYSLRSSLVPQTGLLETDLKFSQAAAGDQIYQLVNGQYEISTFLGPGVGWLNGAGVEPTIQVGEGFFIENASGASYDWVRDFSVNNP